MKQPTQKLVCINCLGQYLAQVVAMKTYAYYYHYFEIFYKSHFVPGTVKNLFLVLKKDNIAFCI